MNRQEHLQVKGNAGPLNTFIRAALTGRLKTKTEQQPPTSDTGLPPGAPQAGGRSAGGTGPCLARCAPARPWLQGPASAWDSAPAAATGLTTDSVKAGTRAGSPAACSASRTMLHRGLTPHSSLSTWNFKNLVQTSNMQNEMETIF